MAGRKVAGGGLLRASERRARRPSAPIVRPAYAVGDQVFWASLGVSHRGRVVRLFEEAGLVEIKSSEGRRWRLPPSALTRLFG
jgi:hypothetical protein